MVPSRSKLLAKQWMQRARSNLERAELAKTPNSFLEDQCFDAQQAAEKALKAICILRGARFPYTHDLGKLIDVLELDGLDIPQAVKDGQALTDYAVNTRYPSWGPPVTEDELKTALSLAKVIFEWSQSQLGDGGA